MAKQSPFTGTPLGYADTIDGAGIALSGIDCGNGVRAGTKCFVATGTQYWTLTVSAAVVNHTTVEAALNFPAMRWILDAGGGPANPSVTNVPTHAALLTLDSSTFVEGTACVVDSLECVWDLLPSTRTAVPFVNVAASGKPGFQWVRRINRNPLWETQTAWTVDPQNLSTAATDDGPGTALVPLASMQELGRRLTGAIISTSVAVTLQSSMNATDITSFATMNIVGAAVFSIVGTPTVIYTGSLTAVPVVPGAAPTVGDYQITDAAIPVSYTASGLLANGVLFQRVGAVAAWWAAKDLGAKTLRTSAPANTNGAATPLANGDAYTASTLPVIFELRFPGVRKGSVIISTCEVRFASTGVRPDAIFFERCAFTTNFASSFYFHATCCWTIATSFDGNSGSVSPSFAGCMFRGVFTVNFQPGGSYRFVSAPLVVQNSTLSLSGCNMTFSSSDLLLYDNASAAGAFQASTNSDVLIFLCAIGGSGNTGALMINANRGAHIAYVGGIGLLLAGSSSSGTPVNVGTSAVAVGALPIGITYAGATAGCGIYASS